MVTMVIFLAFAFAAPQSDSTQAPKYVPSFVTKGQPSYDTSDKVVDGEVGYEIGCTIMNSMGICVCEELFAGKECEKQQKQLPPVKKPPPRYIAPASHPGGVH